MKNIAIYGAGGLGKEIKTVIDAINEVQPAYHFIGYFDDGQKGEHILGDCSVLNNWQEELYLVIGVGAPAVKKKIAASIINHRVRYETLIHPQAIIGDTLQVKIGKGTVITAGCVLTTDIIIGDHVLINLNTTIGHDAVIGDFCAVMPGVNIAGAVTIGESVMVGAGANIINGVNIAPQAVVGAGAVVLKNVRPSSTVVGVPAREK